MESRNYTKEGMILMIGGMQFVIAMLAAESLYPSYNVATNYISDLGVGPSALIFNVSAIIFGICVMYAGYLLSRSFPKFSMLLMASGLGAILVGVFTEHAGDIHGIAATITFVFSGISALYAYTVVKKPFNYLSLATGLFIFIAIILFKTSNTFGMGIGGIENMIVVPSALWVIAFGGYLVGWSKD